MYKFKCFQSTTYNFADEAPFICTSLNNRTSDNDQFAKFANFSRQLLINNRTMCELRTFTVSIYFCFCCRRPCHDWLPKLDLHSRPFSWKPTGSARSDFQSEIKILISDWKLNYYGNFIILVIRFVVVVVVVAVVGDAHFGTDCSLLLLSLFYSGINLHIRLIGYFGMVGHQVHSSRGRRHRCTRLNKSAFLFYFILFYFLHN